MAGYSEIRSRISRDLESIGRSGNARSISEIAEDYLPGYAHLGRESIEKIIMEEALKQKIAIH